MTKIQLTILCVGLAGFLLGIIFALVFKVKKIDWMPDIEDVEIYPLSEHCQDCKEEFGHPDNCLDCPNLSELLQEAGRRFSDLWTRIDTFREDDEDSWVTSTRILDHYKETYNRSPDTDMADTNK